LKSESAKPESPHLMWGLPGRGNLAFIMSLLISLFINFRAGNSQEILVIHPNVGATIDLEEKI